MNTLFVAQKHIRLSQTDSTNNYTTELIRQNDIVEGTVVSALFQTMGKGQRNKAWESYPDKNLLFSVAVRPTFLPINKQFYISKAAALALAQVLESFGVKDVHIKWPNDILAADKKIAGILIENQIRNNQLEWSIIGIGLNVNQRYFPEFPFPATSMRNRLGLNFDLDEVLSSFAVNFENFYLQLKNKGFSNIDAQYHDKLYVKDAWQLYELEDASFQKLMLKHVDESGKAHCIDEKHLNLVFNQQEIKLTRKLLSDFRKAY